MQTLPQPRYKNKCFKAHENEVIIHRYSPSRGSIVSKVPNIIDPRIYNALESGVQLSCEIFITSWRILFNLNVPGFNQAAEMYYDDLLEIRADNDWQSPSQGVSISNQYCFSVLLRPTRPHFVAVELWIAIALATLQEFDLRGDMQSGLALIKRLNMSTVKVPNDFVDLKGESFISSLISVGLCLPENCQPYIDESVVRKCVPESFKARILPQQRKPLLDEITESSSKKNFQSVLLPYISGGPFRISKWLVGNLEYLVQGEPIVEILREDLGSFMKIKAICSGKLLKALSEGAVVEMGDNLAIIYCNQMSPGECSITAETKKDQLVQRKSTSDSLKQGSISATAGAVPTFIPSLGKKPDGFDSTGTLEGDLKYALSTAHVSFQSFFNDLHVVTANGISDDIISLPCFDEGLYCSLVKEMHRYSLVEISNNHDELAKNNAGLGAMVGSFIGIITGNIFAPFLGHTYGKNLTDRGKPIEQFLPDPNLLFYQDDNSYLSWSRAQVNSPRLRRIIFNRQLSEDGKIYFRLIPAIVTADSVLPVQLFKVNDSTYFYRPLAAGIDRNQPNYDTIRIQKKYFHLRGEGMTEKTDFEIDIYGNDVEPNEKIRLHRFTGQSLDYFYADFKILPGSIF
jgi:hypothetical protein